jgi:hypothetical protein
MFLSSSELVNMFVLLGISQKSSDELRTHPGFPVRAIAAGRARSRHSSGIHTPTTVVAPTFRSAFAVLT